MNYDFLKALRLERFTEVLKYLPKPIEIPAELLVISIGEQPSTWSYRHVEMPGQTMYFIFRKAGFVEAKPATWECVDRELNDVMETLSASANF